MSFLLILFQPSLPRSTNDRTRPRSYSRTTFARPDRRLPVSLLYPPWLVARSTELLPQQQHREPALAPYSSAVAWLPVVILSSSTRHALPLPSQHGGPRPPVYANTLPVSTARA